MAEIPLTHGHVAIVDDADVPALSKHRWYTLRSKNNGTLYAARHGLKTRGEPSVILMHRVIMGLGRFSVDPVEVDHIDGNGLNNKKGNLRKADRFSNARNRTRRDGGWQGVRAVAPGRYEAVGARRRVGTWRWPRLAAAVRDGVLSRMWGPDAFRRNVQGVGNARLAYAMALSQSIDEVDRCLRQGHVYSKSVGSGKRVAPHLIWYAQARHAKRIICLHGGFDSEFEARTRLLAAQVELSEEIEGPATRVAGMFFVLSRGASGAPRR